MAGEALFFVDTGILIAHLRQTKNPTILEIAVEEFGTPVASDFVVFELEVGARRSGRSFEFRTNFPSLQTYPMSQTVLFEAADIQATLIEQGQVIGLPDTFIAATAIVHDLPLFTLNAKHFERISRVRLLESQRKR